MGLIANTLPDTTPTDFLAPGKMLNAKSTGYDPTLGTVNLDIDTVSGQLDKILGNDSPYVTRARNSATQASNARGLINTTMGAQAGEAAAIDAALPIASQDANTFSTQRLTNQAASNTADQFGAGAANQAGIINANAGNQIAQQKIVGEQALANIGATGTEARSTLAQQGSQNIAAIRETGSQSQALQQQKAAIDQALLTAEGAQKTSLLAQQGQINAQLQVQRASDDLAMQGLRGTQAERIANIQGTYSQLLQTSVGAVNVFTNLSREIGDILVNNDLTPENKQAAIDILITTNEAALAIMGGTADLNLNGMLGPVTQGGPSGTGNTPPATGPVYPVNSGLNTGAWNAPANNATIQANAVRTSINEMYQSILGRDADPGGLAAFSAEVAAGRMSFRDVETALNNSAEKQGRT